MKVLVTGGVGYIGTHVVNELLRERYSVVVADNFASGGPGNIHYNVGLEKVDLADEYETLNLFQRHQFDAVIHLAGSINVAESIVSPEVYYRNNVTVTQNLLNAMRGRVNNLVFASTSAVYGEGGLKGDFIEDHPTEPKNPYGQTKLVCEKMIEAWGKAHDINYVVLRYFNVAGADHRICENLSYNHLIPATILVAEKVTDELVVNGYDYETPDGTCIRDYVDVRDVARANTAALRHLINGGENLTLNVGSGIATSVLDVVKMVKDVTGKPICVKYKGRREGDIVCTVAVTTAIRNKLGWVPEFSDLKTIVADTYIAMAYNRAFGNRVG